MDVFFFCLCAIVSIDISFHALCLTFWGESVQQELKERRDALIAEKRVILMKIEELKLRQEVRTLERDVSKAHDELRSLASKEEKEEMQMPRTPQVPTEELVNAQQQRSMILSSGEVDIRDTPNELMGIAPSCCLG